MAAPRNATKTVRCRGCNAEVTITKRDGKSFHHARIRALRTHLQACPARPPEALAHSRS